MPHYYFLPPIGLALLVAGCAAPPVIPPPLELPGRLVTGKAAEMAPPQSQLQLAATPKPPPGAEATGYKPPAGTLMVDPDGEVADIILAFEQVPLPSFVQAVFGTILKKNVTTDPAIMSRTDLVTLRTGKPQKPSEVFGTVQLLLKSYGIAVFDIGGMIRVLPDSAKVGYQPEIRRGRALPETPLPLRPIFQLVELEAVRNAEVAGWIKTMFGDKVKMLEDASRNALLLSGSSDDIRSVLEVIHVLDQPLMKGRQSVRISPAYWSADDLAQKLVDVLVAEGYSASLPAKSGGMAWPITLLPVSGANAVFVFALSEEVLNHVTAWAKELDKPSTRGGSGNIFSYQAQYVDAESLAKTVQALLGRGSAAQSAPVGGAAAATRPAGAQQGQVVVDKPSNTLIFQGSGEDFGALRNLLQTLDKPAREALIEVTVAEVQLKDNLQLGVEWYMKDINFGRYAGEGGTLGSLGIGSAGLTVKAFDPTGTLRGVINALASNNKASILSSPRVLAKNGESAIIQVGQEVPIITSQQSGITGTTTGVLQTVQYRTAGIVLNVKPVIHSGDQVDLEIQQEVSAPQSTTTGVNVSPTFTTRKIQTKLTLKNGATVLLGGLISSNRNEGDAGIPLLKDIPLLGQMFRNDTRSGDSTELVVLITPYIIGDDIEAAAVTKAFRDRLGSWARDATLPPAIRNQTGAPATKGAAQP